MSLAAFVSVANAPTSGVRVYIEVPSKPLQLEGRDCYTTTITTSVSGDIYARDGLAARFSDLLYSTSLGADTYSPATTLPKAPGIICAIHPPSLYETQIALSPGEYNLRVVFSDGKNFGRAEMPLVVDGYDSNRLGLSEIALVKHYRQVTDPGDQLPTTLASNYLPLVSKGIEVTPTADSKFARNGPFYFYFEVYAPQHSGSASATIEAHLRIVDSKTGQVAKDLQLVNAASYAKPGDPVIPIGGGIDSSGLPSGSYRLEVQATDSAGNATPWRTVTFMIE